jgi:hypothetical protein
MMGDRRLVTESGLFVRAEDEGQCRLTAIHCGDEHAADRCSGRALLPLAVTNQHLYATNNQP